MKRTRQYIILLATAALLQSAITAAADTAEPPLARDIIRLLAQFSGHSGIPLPDIDDAEFESLLAGHSIVRTAGDADFQEGGTVDDMGLLGLQYVEAPRVLVWLTLLGGGGRSDGQVVSTRLSNDGGGRYVRYQHVDLPWPIRDRHWVILCEKNPALATASDGAIWEHRWALHADGPSLLQSAFDNGRIPRLDQRALDKSIYLPANRGTWAVFDLGEHQSLIVAFYDSHLGGRLPAGLVRSFTRRQLQKYLEASGTLARQAASDYDDSSPIHDGFGRPISLPRVRDAARGWTDSRDTSPPGRSEPAAVPPR